MLPILGVDFRTRTEIDTPTLSAPKLKVHNQMQGLSLVPILVSNFFEKIITFDYAQLTKYVWILVKGEDIN